MRHLSAHSEGAAVSAFGLCATIVRTSDNSGNAALRQAQEPRDQQVDITWDVLPCSLLLLLLA
jgi:hypothetical protein